MSNFLTYATLMHEIIGLGGEIEIKVGVGVINKLIIRMVHLKRLTFNNSPLDILHFFHFLL
jgi:hypothetical protein